MILEYRNSPVHFTVKGKGETIVLLHGFLENVDMWKNLAPALSQNNQVICIDLLGHGKTGCLGYVHTMETMAEIVLAVLEHLNIASAHFVGHSMGGYVTLALAETNPELFKGLCLMNSTFEADDEELKLKRTNANKMAQTHFENLVRLSFANLFAVESRMNFKKEYNNALNLALKTTIQGYIAGQEGMRLRPNRLEVFKNLNSNKLIIIGKKDTVINRDSIISKIKETDIDYVEFSEGHMSHIENLSELSYYLLRFVEK